MSIKCCDWILHIPEASVGHGEGGRTSAILSLDDLITAKLNTVHEGIVLVIGDGY